MLAYPDFDKDFTLESYASKQGLGDTLSHYQDDKKLNPVAYGSFHVKSPRNCNVTSRIKAVTISNACNSYTTTKWYSIFTATRGQYKDTK